MFRVRTLDEIARLRAAIARVGKLSDGLIRIGPLGIGIDGVLAWIPVIPVGAIYSLLAGAYLVGQGYRARVAPLVLAQAVALLALRTAVTATGEAAPPFILAAAGVDLFRAHKWTADLMLRAIDQTHYVEGPQDASNPRFTAADGVRRDTGKRRLVFLG